MIGPNGTAYVDNTILRTVARCESEVALRHALGLTIPEDAHQLEVGIAAHEVLADYFRGEPAERCLKKYELLYRGYSEDHRLDFIENPWYRLSWTNTRLILAEWFETHSMNAFSFSVPPGMVEVGFQLPLSDECVCGTPEDAHPYDPLLRLPNCAGYRPAFVFQGRLDAIVQATHDNSLYVLDHKTTGRLTPYFAERYRNDSQMTGYVWAAQKTLGQPVVGVFINAIEFSKLPTDPVRKCREHGVVYAECGRHHLKSELMIYTRSPDQLDDWRLAAIKLAREYRRICREVQTFEDLTKTHMMGMFHGACGFCNFQKFCQANRPLHYAESMLVYSPWRPFSEEEAK